MDDELSLFVRDLVTILQERYNQALEDSKVSAEGDAAFWTGANFAFYATLDIIRSQLLVYDRSLPETSVPKLGQKVGD